MKVKSDMEYPELERTQGDGWVQLLNDSVLDTARSHSITHSAHLFLLLHFLSEPGGGRRYSLRTCPGRVPKVGLAEQGFLVLSLYQKARNACGNDVVPRKPGGSLAARSANLFCFVQGILEGFFVACFQLGIFSLYVLKMLSLPSSGCLPLNSRAHLFKSCSGDMCGFEVLQADSGMTAGW